MGGKGSPILGNYCRVVKVTDRVLHNNICGKDIMYTWSIENVTNVSNVTDQTGGVCQKNINVVCQPCH